MANAELNSLLQMAAEATNLDVLRLAFETTNREKIHLDTYKVSQLASYN